MPSKRQSYIVRRFCAFKYAARGAWFLLRREPSIQVQAVIGLVVTIAGFYFDISTIEWIMQTLAISLVLGVEAINTALEELADYIQPNHDHKIGRLKDMAAGAVLFVALGAVVTGCLIYIPKF
jgi:diacylglycerol kinase (ATP)